MTGVVVDDNPTCGLAQPRLSWTTGRSVVFVRCCRTNRKPSLPDPKAVPLVERHAGHRRCQGRRSRAGWGDVFVDASRLRTLDPEGTAFKLRVWFSSERLLAEDARVQVALRAGPDVRYVEVASRGDAVSSKIDVGLAG
jgi:hypothetical protein